MTPNHFRINYQYRDYHFTTEQLAHASPAKPDEITVNLSKIHNPENVLGLILAFYVSFALSARKTAVLLRRVFNIRVSHQTVLNYAQAAAYYAHQFNMDYKGTIDDTTVADETYIKIKGKENYVWFAVSADKRIITAYHVADNRGTKEAVTTIKEAIRTSTTDQKIKVISDGLGSYTEAIQFLNKERELNPITHRQVIGLVDMDEVSAEYRPFKQIIERLNRTYKHHVMPSAGFNSFNGATALTALFVAYYNFLRPHSSLYYKPPVQIEELEGLDTIQAQWIELLSMMF